MLCPHCDNDIPIGQQYCSFCGKRVVVEFEHIESSVIADAVARRARILDRVLINGIGALAVIWALIHLLNDYYHQDDLKADRAWSACFEAPRAEAAGETRLPVEVQVPVLALPRPKVTDPQGFTWRRGPFKNRLREAAAGKHARAAETAVVRALGFLQARQQADGGWLVYGPEEGGQEGFKWARVEVSALACLALLGDGRAWGLGDDDELAAAARAGIRFLLANQDAKTGRIGPANESHLYHHGIATAALAEAYGLTGDPALRRPAEKAVAHIFDCQQKSGGWNLTAPLGSRTDTLATAWQVSALLAAREAGLRVAGDRLAKSLDWIDAATSPGSMLVGLDRPWKRGDSYAPTAAGLAVQIWLGRSPSSAAIGKQSAALLSFAPPAFNPKAPDAEKMKGMDSRVLFFGTGAFHRLGGHQWQTWHEALIKALTAAQTKDGSWPPIDARSRNVGKVAFTALAALALEVYYRYP